MRMVLLVAAAAALLGGAAQANEDPNAGAGKAEAQRAPSAAKVLYVCGEDEAAWRPFSRDLGVPEFVTAKQVRADTEKTWAAPKCITASELRRLKDTQVTLVTPKPAK